MAKPDLPVQTNALPRVGAEAGIRLREDTANTNHKGEPSEKFAKRTRTTLERLHDALTRLLGPDEAVLFVTEAQAPVGSLEQITMGWYIYQVSRVVLVFTNLRILHFAVKPKSFGGWEWKQALRGIHWGDISSAKVSGFLSRMLELTYHNGKKEKYWAIKGGDAKKIQLLVGALLPNSTGETTAAAGPVNLCPKCFAALTRGVYQCAQCRQEFKDEKTMVRRSLLVPGGGYIYTRHWFLAFPDFFVESLLLFMVVFYFLVAAGVMADVPGENGEAPLSGGAALFAAVFFTAVLVLEKAVTIHHCRRFIRDYMPI